MICPYKSMWANEVGYGIFTKLVFYKTFANRTVLRNRLSVWSGTFQIFGETGLSFV